MRRIEVAERRARLGLRHHLAAEAHAADVVTLAGDLVGLHATDPATIYLAAHARVDGFATGDLEDALYEGRTLLRALGMRRTLFVVPLDLLAVMQAACTDAIATRERRRIVKELVKHGIPEAERWLEDAEAATLAELQERGEAFGRKLGAAVPQLRTKLMYAEGKSYGGLVALTTRVLTLLAAQGLIARGRPRGGWTSSEHRWVPMSHWLPDGIPQIAVAEARAELVRRWLTAFGPATVADVQWWTGWSLGDTRKALAALDTVEVELDAATTGVVLAGDEGPVAAPEPWAALLPGLDPAPMGWKERDWYLGPHRARLFDSAGNVGRTIWWDGRIVGGWGQRLYGEIRLVYLEDVGADATAAIEAAAAGVQAFVGDTRVMSRFPTPLERELAVQG